MTLNGVIALILRYFAKSGSFRAHYIKVAMISHQQILSRENVIKYTN